MLKSKKSKIFWVICLFCLLSLIYLFVVELSKHYGFDKIQPNDDVSKVYNLMGEPDFISHDACNSPCEQRFIYANWFTLGISELVIELDVGRKVRDKTEYISP